MTIAQTEQLRQHRLNTLGDLRRRPMPFPEQLRALETASSTASLITTGHSSWPDASLISDADSRSWTDTLGIDSDAQDVRENMNSLPEQETIFMIEENYAPSCATGESPEICEEYADQAPSCATGESPEIFEECSDSPDRSGRSSGAEYCKECQMWLADQIQWKDI